MTAPAQPRPWQDISPTAAVGLDLGEDLTIQAPLNERGERCPWPWGPQQLRGVPLGQYNCEHCGAKVIAGIPHIDYRNPPTEPPCPRCTGTSDCHQLGCQHPTTKETPA
jgi:hypothetical protein